MPDISAVREVERWTPTNVLGGLVLLALLIWFLYWAIRRFLRG